MIQIGIYIVTLFVISSTSDLCHISNKPFFDISTAIIEPNSIYQYHLAFFDSTFTRTDNQTQVIFIGNFSRLILKNTRINKQFTFYGEQMILKMNGDHSFIPNKQPDIEIQIIYQEQGENKDNPYKTIILSQLFMKSKFQNKVEINLSKILSFQSAVLETSKLIKVRPKMTVLMYKSLQEYYPCRSDQLCLVKKDYQLISEKDYQLIHSITYSEEQSENKRKIIKNMKMYEINGMNIEKQ